MLVRAINKIQNIPVHGYELIDSNVVTHMIKKWIEYKVFVWDNVEGTYFIDLDLSVSEYLLIFFFLWKTTATTMDSKWSPLTSN